MPLETCSLTANEGASLGDDGHSLTLDGEGDEEPTSLEIDDLACVLITIDTLDSVISLMSSTRALDGRQDADWGSIDASWSYHPDNGLDIILTDNS